MLRGPNFQNRWSMSDSEFRVQGFGVLERRGWEEEKNGFFGVEEGDFFFWEGRRVGRREVERVWGVSVFTVFSECFRERVVWGLFGFVFVLFFG